MIQKKNKSILDFADFVRKTFVGHKFGTKFSDVEVNFSVDKKRKVREDSDDSETEGLKKKRRME